MIDTSMLWPHQQATYDFGKDLPGLVDGSDPGSGKSLAHAKIIENHLENNKGTRALIVCPKTLVRSAWKQEFTTWLPNIDIALAEAPEDSRIAAFESDAPVVVMNVDGLKWLAHQGKRWVNKQLGDNAVLVCDESHTLKNPTAQRTKAAIAISKLFKKKHIASGTIAPNSVTELWSQMMIVDGGIRLGKRYFPFRNLMQDQIIKGRFSEWHDKPHAVDVVYGLLNGIVIRHSFDEVMKHVPSMDQRVVWYELGPKHMDKYRTLERDAYIEHRGKVVNAVNAAALAGKLLQCASGAIYSESDERRREWTVFDSERYELIADLVEGREHCIVFWLWEHQRDELQKIFDKRKIVYGKLDGSVTSAVKREQTVNDLQEGKMKCLLMHPDTGAYGLTLTKATSVIYASPVYEAKRKIQGDARVRRGMQDKVTESIVIIAKDTRDEIAYQVFSGKRDRLDALNNLFENKDG